MRCRVCEKEIISNGRFCSNCGTPVSVNIEKSKISVHQIVLVLVNILLSIFIAQSAFALGFFLLGSIMLIVLGFIFTYMIPILPLLELEPLELTLSLIDSVKEIILFVGLLFVVLLAFNGLMIYLMYKRNKQVISTGTFGKTTKIKYFFIATFFGCFGVHRFMINDKKGGVIRLLLSIFGFVFIFLSFDLAFILFGVNCGLILSDISIGLSKVSDENRQISI